MKFLKIFSISRKLVFFVKCNRKKSKNELKRWARSYSCCSKTGHDTEPCSLTNASSTIRRAQPLCPLWRTALITSTRSSITTRTTTIVRVKRTRLSTLVNWYKSMDSLLCRRFTSTSTISSPTPIMDTGRCGDCLIAIFWRNSSK